jgi:two-component system, cell cycle response regulator
MSVILPNHTLGEAMAVAERVRNEIAGVRVASVGDCAVTASLGVATIPETSDAKTMTTDADRALYQAKHSGRNRVCCAAKGDSQADIS